MLFCLLLPQLGFAQSPPFIVAYPAGTPIVSGTPGVTNSAAVDKYGTLNVNVAPNGTPGPISGTVNVVATPGAGDSFLKREDTVHVTADAGVQALAVSQDATVPAIFGAAGDYSPIAVNTYGAPLCSIDQRLQISDRFGLLKIRASTPNAGDAAVPALFSTNTNLGAGINTNNTYGVGAVAVNGAIWTEIAGSADSNSAGKIEDAVATSGDALVGVAGVVNATNVSKAADGDYTGMALTQAGAALTVPINDSTNVSRTIRATTAEDEISADGEALHKNGYVRADSIAVPTGASGDWGWAVTDPYQALIPGTWHLMAAQDATLAFGSVTTTYATLLTNSVRYRQISVLNLLDKPVMLSLNASNGFTLVAAGGVAYVDLASNNVSNTGNVSVKSLGANATSGNIYITAFGAN